MERLQVVPYDSIWQHLFLEEKKHLQSLLKEHSINIEHIGSTAIPGLSAKPIIDILIVVKDSKAIDAFTQELSALGYESKGERGVIGNRYFKKYDNYGEVSHHLHIYDEDSPHILRLISFRDYLRTFNGERERYSRLKHDLVVDYPGDSNEYYKGKDSMIKEFEKKAEKWYLKSNDIATNH
ncbi:GrpB family protein [Mammaliicoccus vitulinus]|uniref:GrpB family protein n=1 Tax=Mammaliicoccus vitulinus TaxID=71237 RepID=UPI003B9DF21A